MWTESLKQNRLGNSQTHCLMSRKGTYIARSAIIGVCSLSEPQTEGKQHPLKKIIVLSEKNTS